MPEILISRTKINSRVKELAERISADFSASGAEKISIIWVANGAVMFAADLARNIKNLAVSMDCIKCSSYGEQTISSGRVQTSFSAQIPVRGEHVLFIDDIIDTGNTSKEMIGKIKKLRPKSLKTCFLLSKEARRSAKAIKPDYVGFEIPDLFVYGYGLDAKLIGRNLPDIRVM